MAWPFAVDPPTVLYTQSSAPTSYTDTGLPNPSYLFTVNIVNHSSALRSVSLRHHVGGVVFYNAVDIPGNGVAIVQNYNFKIAKGVDVLASGDNVTIEIEGY